MSGGLASDPLVTINITREYRKALDRLRQHKRQEYNRRNDPNMVGRLSEFPLTQEEMDRLV